jgi:hypothetical protein
MPYCVDYRPPGAHGPFVLASVGRLAADGAWTVLPKQPEGDQGRTAVWTGGALLVLPSGYIGSGTTALPGQHRLGGHPTAWDPSAGTWTELPMAPAEGYDDAAVVWTGDRLVVWGDLYTQKGDGTASTTATTGLTFGPP